MPNTKLLLLIIGLILLFVLILFLRITTKSNIPGIIPKPTPTQMSSVESEELVILGSNASQELLVGEPLVIKFNKPVRANSVITTITPSVGLTITNTDKLTEISIKPETSIWQYNTEYTMLIIKAEDYDGKRSGKTQEIKFKTLPYSGI